MIDHVILNVTNLEVSRRFYERALAPLGYKVVIACPEGAGFGDSDKPYFWVAARAPRHTRVHVAFTARGRSAVESFYAAALEAGGIDNGAPGIREHYHPSYYAAFVLDPDGNNIEAVCHDPQG